MRTTGRSFGFLLAATAAGTIFTLSGCDSEEGHNADPVEVQQEIQAHVPNLIADGTRALDFGRDRTFDTSKDSISALSRFLPGPDPERLIPGEEEMDFFDDGPLVSFRNRMRDGAALARFLNDNIFTAEVYEGDGRFRVEGRRVCGVDSSCLKFFQTYQVRIHAVTAGDGVDLTLEFGQLRAEPLTIELRSNRVAAVFNLAGIKRAMAVGTDPSTRLPDVMEGVFALSMIRHGVNDVEFALGIRNAIEISGTNKKARPYKFLTGSSDTLASARANLAGSTLALSLDLGRTILELPVYTNSTLALDLKGATFETVLSRFERNLVVTNIGLGDGVSTAKLDGTNLISVELLGDSDNQVDLTVTPDREFVVAPSLGLRLNFHLVTLAGYGEDDLSPWLLDTNYALTLDGARPTVKSVEHPVTGLKMTKVVSGRMKLTATSGSQITEVEVLAGQCLASDGDVVSGENGPIGKLRARSCP